MRLVLVEWVDSYGCSSNWTALDDPLAKPHIMNCRSVGWLAHDGDEAKVLIPHMAELEDGEAKQACGDMTIPTRAVVRMLDLSHA